MENLRKKEEIEKINEPLREYINNIIQGDCIEILKKFPDNSVDMVFVDPPYNLGKEYELYEDNKEAREYIAWCEKWLTEIVRETKPTGSIFVMNIPRWLTYFAEHLNKKAYFKHWIVWNSMGKPKGKTLLPSHYGILWYVKSKEFKFYDIRAPHPRCRKSNELIADWGGKKEALHPFGPLVSDVFSDIHRIRHKKRRDEHPSQLPVPLLERLILATTDEGDIVLDPMVGTGTTCVAAKRLGRRFIGIDIDPKYVEISHKNLEKAKPTQINGCYVSIFLDKIITIRDKDYKKIESFLEPTKLRINDNKWKEMRLPRLKKGILPEKKEKLPELKDFFT
jgi:site-specific DNA-methyltransferase (adenine-specific)